jgi:hypothetical protein
VRCSFSEISVTQDGHKQSAINRNNCDGHHIGIMEPRGKQQSRTMEIALATPGSSTNEKELI